MAMQKNLHSTVSQSYRIPYSYDYSDEMPRVNIKSRICWGAVLAGLLTTLSVHLVLNLLSIGLSAAFMMPNSHYLSRAVEFSLGSGLLWVVVAILSAGAGGYVAGQFTVAEHKAASGWHGLTVWTATVIVIAVLMTTSTGTLMSGNFRAVADITQDRAQITDAYHSYGGPRLEALKTRNGTNLRGFERTPDRESVTRVLAVSAMFSALALIMGALTAWFAAIAGARKVNGAPAINHRMSTEKLH